jgi:hypothetical protein
MDENASAIEIRTAQVAADAPRVIDTLHQQLGHGPFALICLFVSPVADFARLTHDAQSTFAPAQIVACTTAGELGAEGYEDGQVLAVAFPSASFAGDCLPMEHLHDIDEQWVIDSLIQRRLRLNQRAADMASEFAFLMVDGLSQREEHLTSLLSLGLGPMPLFGGSSGDGMDFASTFLSHNGQILHNGAVIAMIRTRCAVEVFSLDHFRPTDTRMVVTKADPHRRAVLEINGEPAAREYARLLGKDPDQLTAFVFAAHPVVVRLGASHHVRAIQRVSDNGELMFFSAVDEGMVLPLADHKDMSDHLEQGLSRLAQQAPPQVILGCDCMLRKLEAGEVQKTREISQILRRHNVVGFSTYGEQIGGLHVNQTFTGVAIYASDQKARRCH